MKKNEIWSLFSRIAEFYPFNGDDDKAESWYRALKNTPYEVAYDNLCRYASTAESRFAPHPGILSATVEHQGQHVPNQHETKDYFKKIDKWRENAVPMPDHLRKELNKLVRS